MPLTQKKTVTKARVQAHLRKTTEELEALQKEHAEVSEVLTKCEANYKAAAHELANLQQQLAFREQEAREISKQLRQAESAVKALRPYRRAYIAARRAFSSRVTLKRWLLVFRHNVYYHGLLAVTGSAKWAERMHDKDAERVAAYVERREERYDSANEFVAYQHPTEGLFNEEPNPYNA